MKRFLAGFVLGVVLCGGLAFGAVNLGTYKGYAVARLSVNGQIVQIAAGDVPPMVMDGRVLVPIRTAGEALGATVTWEQETLTASFEIIAAPEGGNGVTETNGIGTTVENAGITVTVTGVDYDDQGWVWFTAQIVNSTAFPVKINGRPTATLSDSIREGAFNNGSYTWICSTPPTTSTIFPGESIEGKMGFQCWPNVRVLTLLWRCILDPYGTETIVEFGPWTLEE